LLIYLRLAGLLADEFGKRPPADFKELSDSAMSREGIYENYQDLFC
jgi:hypothetical protein